MQSGGISAACLSLTLTWPSLSLADAVFPPHWRGLDDQAVAAQILSSITKEARDIKPELRHLMSKIPANVVTKWNSDPRLILAVSYYSPDQQWQSEVHATIGTLLGQLGLSTVEVATAEQTKFIKLTIRSPRRDALAKTAEACQQEIDRGGANGLPTECYGQLRLQAETGNSHSSLSSTFSVAASLATGEIYDFECSVRFDGPPWGPWHRTEVTTYLRRCLVAGFLLQTDEKDPEITNWLGRVLYDQRVRPGARGEDATRALANVVAGFRQASP